MHVWYADIGERGELPSPAVLSPDEIDRARRFRFPRDRTRFILARSALRGRLADYLGCPPQDVCFSYNAHGKPSLSASGSPLRFNVSHSGVRAVLAFTAGDEVGVDLERLVPVPDATALAAQFFAPAERQALDAMAPDRRDAAFLSCWTRKEAMVKALGEGLGFPLGRFQVSVGLDEPARLVDMEGASAADFSLVSFEPEEGYLAALAVRGAVRELSVFGCPAGRPSAEETPVPVATPGAA